MPKRNFSPKRNAIYKAICGTDIHPGAKWIYEKLKPEIPDLSLGTVYRNIALFKEEGTVNVVCSLNGEERIDGDTNPHPHFVCTRCGRITDLDEAEPDFDNTAELERGGFKIDRKYVIYYGSCPKCAAPDAAV